MRNHHKAAMLGAAFGLGLCLVGAGLYITDTADTPMLGALLASVGVFGAGIAVLLLTEIGD